MVYFLSKFFMPFVYIIDERDCKIGTATIGPILYRPQFRNVATGEAEIFNRHLFVPKLKLEDI